MKRSLQGVLRGCRTAAIALSALVTLIAVRAEAQPITFTFSGAATGTLAGNPFAASPFTVTIASDISALTNSPPNIVSYLGLPGTVAINGLGVASFTEPLYVFRNTNGPTVGFGNNVNHDLIDISAPVFAGYNLNASFGPYTDFGVYSNSQFTNVATTLGALTFGTVLDRQFRAVVGTTLAPEPATFVLIGVGLSAVGAVKRRRRTAGL